MVYIIIGSAEKQSNDLQSAMLSSGLADVSASSQSSLSNFLIFMFHSCTLFSSTVVNM